MGQVVNSRSPRTASRFQRRVTPFVKWAGGKGRLLAQLEPFLPPAYNAYIEPFLGGGAFYLALEPERALLADLNEDLMSCYRVIREDVDGLLAALTSYDAREDSYYAVRAQQPADLLPVARAARFIYLNKACYNGLYRVNAGGQFNVPFGRFRGRPWLSGAENLRAMATLLRDAELVTAPYWETLARATRGDFVYIDPPYQPLSATASFTAYTSGAFGERDQRTLATLFAELSSRGCLLMLSNSDTPLIRSLYASYRIEEVRATRMINSDPLARGAITELVVLNY